MATAEQIKNLIKAYSKNDDSQFRTVVLQIAAHEAKLGHSGIAQELKKEANNLGRTKSTFLQVQIKQNPMLQYSMPNVRVDELVASETIILKISRILTEYRNKEKLYNNGLLNRRKILLEGKPGTGKTFTSSIIASELNLPLVKVQVDQLLTKFMGETSIRLRQIFEDMYVTTGVYFFDEFDAIGADRDLDNEVGEMRRILNAFLQFIENDSSDSVVIAATNNQSILDKALFRRFDDVIHYELPDDEQITRLLSSKLAGQSHIDIYAPDLIKASQGLSHSELSLVCNDALKEAILYKKTIDNALLISLLNERHRIYQL